jgi:hypothetical protein
MRSPHSQLAGGDQVTATNDPKNLVGWILKMCERPGMYLVGSPDYRKVNVSYLLLMMAGYECALMDAGLPTQAGPFREWIFERRPDLRRNSLWYGQALLPEMGGDDLRVLAQIREWAEEFESSGAAAHARDRESK